MLRSQKLTPEGQNWYPLFRSRPAGQASDELLSRRGSKRYEKTAQKFLGAISVRMRCGRVVLKLTRRRLHAGRPKLRAPREGGGWMGPRSQFLCDTRRGILLKRSVPSRVAIFIRQRRAFLDAMMEFESFFCSKIDHSIERCSSLASKNRYSRLE